MRYYLRIELNNQLIHLILHPFIKQLLLLHSWLQLF